LCCTKLSGQNTIFDILDNLYLKQKFDNQYFGQKIVLEIKNCTCDLIRDKDFIFCHVS